MRMSSVNISLNYLMQQHLERTKRPYYWAFTPAGTMLYETAALTRDGCIKNLLEAAAHMPYGSWKAMEKRGYTLELLDMQP